VVAPNPGMVFMIITFTFQCIHDSSI
jgi:hypothetical protein